MRNFIAKFKILVILLSLSCASVFAQSLYKSSYDGKLFARSDYVGLTGEKTKVSLNNIFLPKIDLWYQSNIKVFSFKNNAMMRSFSFIAPNKGKIDEIGFSANNMYVYARKGNYFTVWDMLTGNEIISLKAIAIGFASFNNYLIAVTEVGNYKTAVKMYDCMRPEDSYLEYTYPRRLKATKVAISNNEKHFFVQTSDNRIIFWNTNRSRYVKTLQGNYAEFSDDGRYLITTYKRRSRAYMLALDSCKKRPVYLTSLVNKFAKQATNNPNAKYRRVNKTHLTLYPGGTTLALEARYRQNRDYVNEVFLIDIKRDTLISHIPNHFIDGDNPWINREKIVLLSSDSVRKIYDLYQKQFTDVIDYNFYIKNENKRKTQENTYISPNHRLAVLENIPRKGNPFIMIKNSNAKYQKQVLEGVKFAGFSNNSRYLIVEDTEGKTGILPVKSLIDIDLDADSLQCRFASNELWRNKPERIVIEDPIEPDNFNYIPFQKMRHISELSPDQRINLVMKTIKSDELNSTLEVHLLDSNGVYYYGASEPEYQNIWKNLILKSSNGIKQISDFNIVERKRTDSIPQAISLILDHSGSMGEDRAVAIQRAAKEFIENKMHDDAVSILKYDDGILVSGEISTNSERLLENHRINGLKDFGGGTALLDATNIGIKQLVNKKGYDSRSVILFTDGCENSSLASEATVIKNAIQTTTNIHTIGFGNGIDNTYLKSLAGYTGGSYFRIYKTNNFSVIFEDIYNRTQNYYAIEFQTDSIDDYTVMLSVKINPSCGDSMFVEFTNQPPDFLKMNQDEKLDFRINSSKKANINITGDFVHFQNSMKEEALKIRDEFANIDFPNINFEVDTTLIVDGSENGIDDVAEFMTKYPKVQIKIYGHTDNSGKTVHNMQLSEKRANVVKDLLVERGISVNRIETKGFGETKPLTTNSTKQGKAANRRVEFVLDMSEFSLPDFIAIANQNSNSREEITTYPNPTDGIFYMRIPTTNILSYKDIKSIQIFDMNGKLISERKSVNSALQQFSLQDKPAGIYLVYINFENTKISRKIEVR